MLFQQWLKKIGVNDKSYLNIVRNNAEMLGLKGSNISFSENPKYKLNYKDLNNNIDFGANYYNDFIIYKLMNNPNAKNYQKNYLKRMFYNVDLSNLALNRRNLTILNWM